MRYHATLCADVYSGAAVYAGALGAGGVYAGGGSARAAREAADADAAAESAAAAAGGGDLVDGRVSGGTSSTGAGTPADFRSASVAGFP